MLTIKLAAAELGVSESLLYALCAARRIRHVRVGLGRGRIMIPADAIDEYRRRQTVEVGAGGPMSAPPLKHITLPS